jgi:hypothetical protein
MSPQPGSRIGDYEVLSQLGAGGMGRVYKVRNELSDRMEAMKVLLPDLEGQADLANRFLREIKTQAGLDHPNIAKLYTAARIDNRLLMFMELVEGITLDERLKQGPIPIADAVNYIAQVLSALDYAHQRGVVHRDIKPANMMLMPDGVVKLLDFGIAKAAADHRLTMTGTTLGSLYYMSPEQIQGSHVDMRSDLYSVGVSLYEMVTGKKPFDGESQFAIMSAHLARNPVAPVEMNTSLPQSLSEIILVALNKDPAARFQTAGAFLNALRTVQPEAGGAAVAATAARVVEAPAAVQAPPPQAPPPPPPPVFGAAVATGPVGLQDSVASVTAVPSPSTPPVPPPPLQADRAAEFHLIEPSETAVKKSGPKRLVWVAVGGLCAALAIVAFIQFGPRIKTSAKETTASVPGGTGVPAPGLNTQPPGQAPAASTPDNPPPADHSVTLPPPAPGKPSALPEGRKPKVERAQVQPSSQRSGQAPAPSAPAQTAPVQAVQQQPAQPQPAAPQPPPAQPDNSMPAMVNQSRMEIQQLRDLLDKLYARAGTVRDLLAQLQSSQASQGVGMRSDWVESFNLTNNYLRRANDALNAGDAATAKSAIQKANSQLSLLEKALGR